MKDRFQTILNLEKLSAAQLAAILGIQRSTLSNILGGRNNPSYEVIHGLLTKLPNLNIDWLLTGEGQPYRNPQKNFRGEKILENKEANISPETEGDFPGRNKSDLFGFEKPDEDFPLETELTKAPSGTEEENIAAKQLEQKREREKAEMQEKMKRLQQIVNEKATAAKRASQPSDNQINGGALHAAGQIKELKKVILLYSDDTFEEYGKN